ncbi:hypothetical protein [Streptomyces chattanoogensis]|uniref:hypothetical protein n=1 Tax=Streptomyces chattanoogensis TaxID=66876 RepID=UPI0005D8A0D6|nr:hypothetical protein T261_1228 [Streptomyces lydicus]
MRKLRTAAVVVATLGSVALLGAGTANAAGGYGGGKGGGDAWNVKSGSSCRSHDLNVDVLGEVGIANGILGNALNGEGPAGAQSTPIGSSMGCNNIVGGGGEK